MSRAGRTSPIKRRESEPGLGKYAVDWFVNDSANNITKQIKTVRKALEINVSGTGFRNDFSY